MSTFHPKRTFAGSKVDRLVSNRLGPPGSFNDRHWTVSSRPVCCSGGACPRTRPICSSMPSCRTRLTGRCCASRDARCMPASPNPSRANSRKRRRADRSCLRDIGPRPARSRKPRALWGKAGQRSAERSAVVEAAEQLKRALDLIATLPGSPARRREEIKLQVALITPLLHVSGYATPETRAAVERARLLIEQAEALGEPPEDPLLLFSVLCGSWAANVVAFSCDVMRELAVQFLAVADKQRAKGPLMIGHRLMGLSLLHTGDIAGGRVHLDRAFS